MSLVSLKADKNLRPRGVHFPFMKRADGLPSADSPPNIFASNIKQILLTAYGERVMRPGFGSNLRSVLHSMSGDPDLLAKVEEIARTAIAALEPRVGIVTLLAELVETTVVIKVVYFGSQGTGLVELAVNTK